MSAIYNTSKGYRLFQADTFPAAVSEFLDRQTRLLDKLCAAHTTLVEVGCGKAEHLRFCLDRGLGYLGIDPVQEYIHEARETYRAVLGERRDIVLGSAESLQETLQARGLPRQEVLALYQFNAIGNARSLVEVIRSLKHADVHYLISTYKTDSVTNSTRLTYYSNCDLTNIRMTETDEGVLFVSDEGFRSYAYHTDYVAKLFAREELELWTLQSSGIGVWYTNALL